MGDIVFKLMTGSYVPITAFGSLGGSAHTSHDALMGGRTPITTEAFEAYNNLRRFLGLDAVELEMVGRWAFAGARSSQEAGAELQL